MFLKVIEWNVHGMNNNSCPVYVAYEINRLEADIAILTEYVENKNFDGDFESEMKKKYFLFRTPISRTGNSVLIAVKKNKKISLDCRNRIWTMKNNNENDVPDFLHCDLKFYAYKITVLGVRIVCKKDYKKRALQLDNLVEYIKQIDNKTKVLVMGDFNNSRIFGEENCLDRKIIECYYQGKDTAYYNLQHIKRVFKDNKFYVFNSTPKGNVFDVFSQVSGNFTYKQDHIFVRGMNVSDTKYNWEYKIQDYKNTNGRDPDHAILVANIEI